MTSAEPGTQNKEGEPSQCLKLLNNNDVIIENNEMTLAECDVRTVKFDFFLNCQINNLSNLAFQFGTFKFKYGKNSLRSGKCNSFENTVPASHFLKIDCLHYTVPKEIDFPRCNMKCSGGNVILRGIFHEVSCFPLHCMLYCENWITFRTV